MLQQLHKHQHIVRILIVQALALRFSLSAMAMFFIKFVLQAVLLAITFSSYAWAMDKPNNNEVAYNGTTGEVNTQNPIIGQQASGVIRPEKGCRSQDISITQKQESSKGTPRFQVAITNTCTDPKCAIQNIIAFCGQFTSAYPIDANVFRRLNNGPHCAVNNLQPLNSGRSLTFQYGTEFMEPIRLASAEPVCHP